MSISAFTKIGSRYDIIVRDTPNNHLLRNVTLVANDDPDFLVFSLNDGRTVAVSRHDLTKMEACR